MKRTENVELTVLCLIHKEDKYLLQDRVKRDWRGGYSARRSCGTGRVYC